MMEYQKARRTQSAPTGDSSASRFPTAPSSARSSHSMKASNSQASAMARLRAGARLPSTSLPEPTSQPSQPTETVNPLREKVELEKDRKIVDDELRYWILEGILDEDVHLPSFWEVSNVLVLQHAVC